MTTYSLFEVRKILSLAKPGGGSGIKIQLSAYTECDNRSILSLVCDNGYLLFYYQCNGQTRPVIRQVNWLHGPGKEIKALSFDPQGAWLLVVTADASIYILPVLPLLDENAKVSNNWKSDNVTEIKLSGQRASLTSVRWWQTLQGQHIAIVGSELGEIAFVNLVNKKEVGGTYITVGISALDILKDESRDTTYLLITGHNRQQWRLLLEEKRSNFYWPFNSEAEAVVSSDTNKKPVSCDRLPAKDEKGSDQKPHHLSKFESGTFLTPQVGKGHNLVSAYNSSSSLLQVLEGDLDQMHLFSYHVPADCENVVLSSKLIFITQRSPLARETHQTHLKILSRKFSEICSENTKKREYQNAEVQSFAFEGRILALYRRSADVSRMPSFKNSKSPCSINVRQLLLKLNGAKESSSGIQSFVADRLPKNCGGNVCAGAHNSNTEHEVLSLLPCDFTQNASNLDGCYVIQDSSVWECRLRFPPELLFLNLTTVPNDLPMAEKLGVMLGLEIHKVYELAAEMQLMHGHFAQAVHLYQLSKCPQLKRIAHFMSYGYLSELIAYIQVLFSTKSVEIVPADKCHFANIALLCFAQQTMEKMHERSAITLAFKRFLRDNIYYDETVAVRLLAEQGLYELLYYFTQVRGQHGLVVETLLTTNGLREAVDSQTHDSLSLSGYEKLVLHLNNDDYMLCMTSFPLLQYLAAKPVLLSQHMQHLITLLPEISVQHLYRIAFLYDLSRGLSKLALRNIAAAKEQLRFWNSGLLTMSCAEKDTVHNEKEVVSEGDVVKFFIFVLLMLCHRQNRCGFSEELLLDIPLKPVHCVHPGKQVFDGVPDLAVSNSTCRPLSCGLAHVLYCYNGTLFSWGKASNGRLGNGDVTVECEAPSSISTFLRLGVKVKSVSCGAVHSLALTDFGVFSWGLSRYGQLGLGDVQHSDHPVIIEYLSNQCIVALQCGQYHSLALTDDGRVYSWGWGVHGQLGHGTPEDVNIPKLIEHLAPKFIVCLGAGQGHSVVLTDKGEVYAFGCGMFGQLGTGSVSKHSLPQLVPLPEPVSKMSSGYFHTVVVSISNNVYVWGCNPQALRLQAQCSRRARQNSSSQNLSSASQANNAAAASSSSSTRASTQNSVQQTHLLPLLVDTSSISHPVSQVSCGNHHTVIVTSTGELYSWGRNMEGQLGNGTRREQKTPTLVTLPVDNRIVHVSCGADFTIAVDSGGRLWGWGKNDSGQVGHKPAEGNTKVPSSSSGGKVITIRTNRRMITITQPNRQSLLRPIEIVIPKDEPKIRDFDSGSFESEYSVPVLGHDILYGRQGENTGDLASYDSPSYGPFALHVVLKAFHSYCDHHILLNHCVSFANFQAAAKICFLRNLYSEALDYQFQAVVADPSISQSDYLTFALCVIKSYVSVLDASSLEKNYQFLYCVVKFWMNYSLPVQPLESVLQKNFDLFSYSLSILLFCKTTSDVERPLVENFVSLLSSDFCLSVTSAVINRIQTGASHFELMEEMMAVSDTKADLQTVYSSEAFSVWNDSVAPERLWQEILHSIQKGVLNRSSLDLSVSDVDILSRSFISGKLCVPQPPAKAYGGIDSSSDIIAFSCSHHYTLQAFRTSVLPSFEEKVRKLLASLPSISESLVMCYDAEEIFASCPKCLLNEIKVEI